MNERFLRVLALALAAVMVVAMVGCAAPAEQPAEETPAATEQPPAEETDTGGAAASEGEALVQSKCSMCHTLDRVNSAKYDEAGWTETVDRMVKNGAVLSAEERAAVIEYLATRDAQ